MQFKQKNNVLILFCFSRAKKNHEYRIEIGFDNAQQKLWAETNNEENHKSESGNFQGKKKLSKIQKKT